MPLAIPILPPTVCRVALAVVASLLVGACTETTVVREVPATPPEDALSVPGGPSDAVFADGSAAAAGLSRTPGAIDPDTVIGAPGAPVDCALTLPCRWSSDDGAFAVTVTSGDDTGPRGGLSVAFRVDTLHDTELAFGGGAEALDANNVKHVLVTRSLGAGNGNAPLGVTAGAGVEGRIDHAAAAGRTHLTSLRLGLVDNGLVREAVFSNLPLGPRESVIAACAFALPCTWTSGDGATTVELVSAGGLFDVRRLTTGFTVTSVDGTPVALAGGSAIGIDGTEFAGRTHTLGMASGFEPVSATTVAGLPRAGTVDFRRTATTPRALLSLRLDLYPDAPVPRWNVTFSNVPLL